jgi:hypothetical protein
MVYSTKVPNCFIYGILSGELKVDTKEGEYAEFIISLPLATS